MIVKTSTIACTHCGLPVPTGLVDSTRDEQFCCGGCQAAYQLIHANGLDAFYRMVDSDGDGQTLRGRAKRESRFLEFDDAAFLQKYAKGLPEGRQEITFSLEGIHCAACVWLIEKLPSIAHGVLEANVRWARRTVTLRWLPSQVALSKIAATLFQLGYTPHPQHAGEAMGHRDQENRRQLIQIGIAAAAAGNNMLIAAALYLGMFSYMSFGMEAMLRYASCGIGLVSLLGPGRIFLRGAMTAIRTRVPHMDLPIALGLSVGGLAGLLNTIRGVGEIYFDSLSVLVFLLLVGRWIQFRQQRNAADAVEMLHRLTPQTARKRDGSETIEIYVDLIQSNDLLEIRPGDLIPVDAEVVEGKSEVDESILTGESRMVAKRVGDSVLAGTQNGADLLLVRATATGRETRLSKIVDLVERATLEKPQIVEWANRIGGYFVATVIALAGITWLIWVGIDASVAINRTVALLIVACPCAVALATPLAISVALGRAAKRKIIIKQGDVFQRLNRPGFLWLDKTGTLTEGKMKVAKWWGDASWLPELAALETKSTHPIAAAIVEFASENANEEMPSDLTLRDVKNYPEGGIGGRVGDRNWLVGTAELLTSHHVPLGNEWLDRVDRVLAERQAPCFGLSSTMKSSGYSPWEIGFAMMRAVR